MLKLNKKTKNLLVRLAMIALFILIGIIVTNQYILYSRLSNTESGVSWDERFVRIARLYDENQKLEQTLSEKNNQLRELQDATLSSDDLGRILENDFAKYRILSGENIVEGRGVIIRIKHRMVLTQMIDFVNALRNSGAEAMSVNEKRIVASTALNEFDNGSDFVIKVIGDKENLSGSLTRPGGIFELIINGTVEKSDNIVLPKS